MGWGHTPPSYPLLVMKGGNMNKAIWSRVLPAVAVLVLVASLAAPLAVSAEACRAERTLPEESVEPGAEFYVHIDVTGCGAFAQVRETLPPGFTYVSVSDPDDIGVEEENDEVRFTFFPGAISFYYTVKAPTTEVDEAFAGVVLDEDKEQFDVTGDDSIAVRDVAPPVGGTAHPISRLPIVAMWVAIGAAIIAGASLLMRRRRTTPGR